ncbi:MAG TPA: L-2-hydroxyglutarate oxidase [Sulfurospirillum arcachonense]|nr:L-2-hydroxyglutarate oxidase [Sulfurospirillum arcachonense]
MYDFLVIGGGIIGLNIAKNLKERDSTCKVVLIDKEPALAMHSSGRNSGVLHAGFYYSADSLKAKFTKDGNKALHEFCEQRGLHVNKCTKVVIATNEEELKGLEELKKRGDKNGVELSWMDEDMLSIKYPNIQTYKKALFSPTTSTVNPKELTLEFAKVIEEMGVTILTNTAYKKRISDTEVLTSQGSIKCKKVINCAGLYADKIAQEYGFAKNYVIIPFKGIYLKDKDNLSKLETNVYPVPNLANPFLGVHYTLTENNAAKIGPTAIPAFWRENYKGFDNFKFDEMIQILFYEAKLFITNAFGFRALAYTEVKKYLKSHLIGLAQILTKNMNHKGYTSWSTPGIRAQLLDTKTLELVQDFVVEGDENSVHILNAVSPAFTSSIPFTNWVVENYIIKK